MLSNCLVENTLYEIEKLITDKKVLVLCDGGSKESEIYHYSNIINVEGSHIMCHDYSDNPTDYAAVMKNTGWKTAPESHYHNIKDCLEDNHFVKANKYTEFASQLWGCFRKD